MTQSLFPVGIALLAFAVPGCADKSKTTAAAKETPATVSKPAKEDDLGTVVLKPEAEKRLGLETVVAEMKPVARWKTYAGEVTVPPGRRIIVSSPFLAKVAIEGDLLVPGQTVKKGQPIVTLMPTLSADALTQYATLKIDIDGQVTQAKQQVDVAKLGVERVQGLLASRSIGAGALEDENNKLALAKTALKNAEARRDDLEKTIREAGAGSIKAQTMNSPENGILRSAQVTSGQQVGVGTPLFEVERLDPIWVRVPVYVGDVTNFEMEKDASVGTLAGRTQDPTVPARPVAAPPSGDPLAATVDLFYELANPKAAYRPGQRIGVSIPLSGTSSGLVIPYSAIYYDIQGGTWVYEQIKDHTFVRRRVEVEQKTGDSVVVTRGIKAGAKVVTVAVPELYGTEFGFAK